MQGKPNILFLFTDDQRFDTIRALGNSEIFTPNMDSLAEQGIVFTHAHIPGGTVSPVCMPSRAMLHTGRTLFHLYKDGSGIPKEHSTMGETFGKAGYKTFGTGKWHNGTESFNRSFSDGETIFFGGMWDHWNVPFCNYDPECRYENYVDFAMDFYHSNKLTRMRCDYVNHGYHSTELIADTAIDFIESYEDNKPFFAYVSFMAPHDPRTMPERFRKMYDPQKITLPDNYASEHAFDYGMRGNRDENLAPYPRTENDVHRHIAEYYGMISHLDDAIGRIIQKLKEKGYYDNTIIVFASDNGLAVGRHGLFGKQNNYDHSVRVPLIFAGPGIPKGLKLSNYVYLLDIFPTLCGLTGIKVPESVEGMDLTPVINNPDLKTREYLYLAFAQLIRSVKNERYKLIEYAGKYNGTQLFDLLADPSETCNLADDSRFCREKEDLRRRLIEFKEEWEDTGHPVSVEYWKNQEKLWKKQM